MNRNTTFPYNSRPLCKRRRASLLSCFLVPTIFVLANLSPGRAAELGNERIYSAFLFNFIGFLTWPQQETFSEFKIGVWKASDGFQIIADDLNQKTSKGKKIKLLRLAGETVGPDLQIVFIDDPDTNSLQPVLSATRLFPVVFISRFREHLALGADIAIYPEAGKMRFEINADLLQNRKIQASSQLLKLAKIHKREL